MSSTSTTKTILFLGGTGGCGFSALRRSLVAGHTCIALCRTPSKLTSKLTDINQEHLHIIQGDIRDVDALARGLTKPDTPSALVDAVLFTIGSSQESFNWKTFDNGDPTLCTEGMKALVAALQKVRAEGATGRPVVAPISSTGVSEYGRDIPIAMIPLYKIMLAKPHKDKKSMEDVLVNSGEAYTVVRPSFFVDGAESKKPLRAGMEDPVLGKVVTKEIGMTITREDVGKWLYENVARENDGKWVNKIASITA